MNTLDLIDPGPFVRLVQPLLEANDLAALVSFLKSRWNCHQITELLGCSNDDARKVAALALSLVGTRCCIEGLARQLRDPDPLVNELADHALWSVWFRLGTPEANQLVHRGTLEVGRKEYQVAINHFDQAIALDPRFAEAYNQRALTYCVLEDFQAAIGDCLKTVELMPCHFGAWSEMGHAHTQLGELTEAHRCYKRALEINPHLSEIRSGLEELEGVAEK